MTEPRCDHMDGHASLQQQGRVDVPEIILLAIWTEAYVGFRVLAILVYTTIGLDPRGGRSIHDRLAGTLVVNGRYRETRRISPSAPISVGRNASGPRRSAPPA